MDAVPAAVRDQVEVAVDSLEGELIAFRHHLHMHPELSGREVRTTEELVERLRVAGLQPSILSSGTGVVCDIDLRGEEFAEASTVVAIRADIDALAMDEISAAHYRSRVPGVAHACGHDVHTAAVLGSALALARSRGQLSAPGIVRVLFEPSEESVPGGAVTIIEDGWLEGVEAIFGLHCDPKTDVGLVGTRVGPITAAADLMELTLAGPGGHTSRPHLTVDLVRVMARCITEIPEIVKDLTGPSGDLFVVFGSVHSGQAANVIPSRAVAQASVRTANRERWLEAEQLVRQACAQVIDATGASWQLDYVSGLPPVVNDEHATNTLRSCITAMLGPAAAVQAPASMGGDSFGWYTERVAGSYARLGTHAPDDGGERLDLHAASFDVDERAIGIGARLLALTALTALHERAGV